MFSWWYLPDILKAIDKIPREVSIGVAAYFIITDIHKRNTQVKIAEINAQTRSAELEVEALQLKLKLAKAG